MNDLTDTDKAILDLAGTWWRYTGAMENAIRDQFNMSATRYWQRVNTLINHPQAWTYAPTTVKRLRGRREHARETITQRRQRSSVIDSSRLQNSQVQFAASPQA